MCEIIIVIQLSCHIIYYDQVKHGITNISKVIHE